MAKISTQQEKPRGNPNPSPETRFGGPRANPQSPGGWDKTESISYQYNKLIRMSPSELENFIPQTVAQQIALTRVLAASDSKSGLPDTKEITDRIEGKAPQSVDITSGGEKLPTVIIGEQYAGNPSFRVSNTTSETDEVAGSGNEEQR